MEKEFESEKLSFDDVKYVHDYFKKLGFSSSQVQDQVEKYKKFKNHILSEKENELSQYIKQGVEIVNKSYINDMGWTDVDFKQTDASENNLKNLRSNKISSYFLNNQKVPIEKLIDELEFKSNEEFMIWWINDPNFDYCLIDGDNIIFITRPAIRYRHEGLALSTEQEVLKYVKLSMFFSN